MKKILGLQAPMELTSPYRTRARVMGEVEEVQEQVNAATEALKEQMATMMEAMMSIK